ncbi:MAG: hypothetical protein AAGC55_06180, partial [Myxococcota bacterium]
GEEYGKVELRRGDVIDLGHVRLRFVEPGEDFVFGRDAQPVPIPSGGGSRLVYFLVALLIVGGLVVFTVTRGDDEGGALDGFEDGGSGMVQGPDQDAQTAAVPDSGPQIDPDSEKDDPPASDRVRELLEQAAQAIDGENWDDAIAAAEQVQGIESNGNDTAKQYLQKAQDEKANQERHDAFIAAVKSNDFAAAHRAFSAVDDDSIYKDRIRDEYDTQRRNYAEKAKADASSLSERGRCTAITEIKKRAQELDPAVAEEVAEIEQRCRKAAQQNRKTSPANSNDSDNNGSTSRPDNSSKPSGRPVAELASDIKKATMAKQQGAAVKTCREYFREAKPRDPNIVALCGRAACKMKRAREAKRYYDALPQGKKSFVAPVCVENGINL